MADRPNSDGAVLRVAVPTMAERLAQPGHVAVTGQRSGLAPAPAPHRPAEEKPVSVLKRLERYFSAFFKLGRTARMAKASNHAIQSFEPRLDGVAGDVYALSDRQTAIEHERDAVAQRLDRLEDSLAQAMPIAEEARSRSAELVERIDELAEGMEAHDQRLVQQLDPLMAEMADTRRALDRAIADIAQASRAYSELSRRMDLQRFRGAAEASVDLPPKSSPPREGLDALLESFYGRLEDRYRGSREEIKGRLAAAYLDDIRAASGAASGRPVLDLGCGRGEWVELLMENGIPARGVDLNPVQIAEAKAKGLPVEQGDAMTALAEAPDGAYAAVTAHHLVEHLPFETVAWMAREALRVLAPGGVLIVETPNVRNVLVGATTFHIDPTHLSPMPAEVLTTLFDTIGFHPVEPRPLHPSDTREGFLREGRADPHIAELLFGPQDLAVLATRPRIA